jgi:hypothetical protein
MNRLKPVFILWCVIITICLLPVLVVGQSSEVSAEAQIRANLRASADVNATLLGEVVFGARYPVVGRSEFFPWVLLGDPVTQQPIGWVFQELLIIYGDVNRVPLSNLVVGEVLVTATPIPASSAEITATFQLQGVALPTDTLVPVSSATLSGVTGLVTGEINIRYGPGVEYPRIGIGRAGDVFQISARHTQLPWVQIRFSGAPNGVGWVATDLLEIQGDIFSVPAISQTVFNLPTLTPTPPAVQPINVFGGTPVPLSAGFQTLGDQLWDMMLQAEFEPETSRLAALFLMDLQTGEAITFGNQIAFSGMSLNKIAILANLYSQLDTPPDLDVAVDVANMMVCSENSASNALLSFMGNGDPYVGAQSVTDFMQRIGLGNTFIVAPFLTGPNVTPQPVRAPTTEADQVRAEPDYSNQMTVDNLGWLLDGIYQCAFNGNGPLMDALPGAYTQGECRQMIDVMSGNNLGQPLLMSAGVPEQTQVAHKHGWTADTHGDAGIVFTPGGNYVLVVALRNPVWLDFGESFPLITEISRTVYNYYNPDALMPEARDPYIVEAAECNVLGLPILDTLTSVNYAG